MFLRVARKKKETDFTEVRTREVVPRVRPKEEAMNGRGGKGSAAGEAGNR